MRAIVGPAALCRMDAEATGRVRRDRDLGPLLYGCLATIVVGTALYGATMGMWRGPAQAAFASIKLVVLFLGLFALTAASNAMLGGVLRTKLSFRQVAACCLLGLAVTAAMLGALAPVAWFLVSHAPALSADHEASLRVAHQLLTAHVVVFAIAGVLGVRRMYGLLGTLIDDPAVARRVLWTWLAVEGLVGAELSWILRPFLGKPGLPITLLRADAFDSGFFDEVGKMTLALFGPSGPWVAVALVVGATVLVALSLSASAAAEFTLHDAGLTLRHAGSAQSYELHWSQVRFVRRVGRRLEIGRFDDATLRADTLVLPCPDEAAAMAAYEAIELTRRGPTTPFRRPAR
jgi:hypothetical protein